MEEITALIASDSVLAGLEGKCISQNRSVKVRISLGVTTYNMHDYLKPFLKRNPENITLHVGTNNLVKETSRDVLNEILSLKNFIEKLGLTCKVLVSNLI